MSVLSSIDVTTFEESIRETIGQPRYDLWFDGNTKLELSEGELWIGVPNRFYREWLERHFRGEIDTAVQKAFGSVQAVRFRIDPSLFQRERGAASPPPGRPAPSSPPPSSRPSRYAFGRFVAGNSNRVAYAAAQTLLEDPRNGYSPLFLFGGIGLGKTHLLRGLAAELSQRQPRLQVLALSCEEFTNQFVEAMRTGKLAGFRRKFRSLDVCLVDDVQFLSGKRATQEEFLHTFNALEARGAKLLLTADVHPRRLAKISEEIRSRFVAGMVARLEPPDQEMRRQILVDKARERNLTFRREVLDYLVDTLIGNVAEIEGALNYLEHYGETLGVSLDLDTTRTALADVLRHTVPVLGVADVRRKACELFGIHPKLLARKSRAKSVSGPRMLVLYLARRFTRASFSEIGQRIGAVNHSTVIAAQRRIVSEIARDANMVLGGRTWKIKDAVESFERELGRTSCVVGTAKRHPIGPRG